MSVRIAKRTERQETEPLLVDVKRLAEMLVRSERAIWRDVSAGRMIAPIKLGNQTRWRTAEVREWVDAGCPDRASWESRRNRAS